MVEESRSFRKTRTGIVTSDSREKTVTVSIEIQFPHPKYKKIVKKTRKLHAHDENFDAKIGDTVKIGEGTFEDFEGSVEAIDNTSGKISVLIEIFGRPTPVELEHWQVEKI